MELFIDTSNSERIIVGVDGEKFETEARKDKSQKLLSFIEQALSKKGKKVGDVKKVKVATGPGSFTGLRVGVSVANCMGWVLGIPVNGKDLIRGEAVDIVYE